MSTRGLHDLVAAAFRNLHECSFPSLVKIYSCAGTEGAWAPHATPIWGRCWVSGGLASPQGLCTTDAEYLKSSCISYVRSERQDKSVKETEAKKKTCIWEAGGFPGQENVRECGCSWCQGSMDAASFLDLGHHHALVGRLRDLYHFLGEDVFVNTLCKVWCSRSFSRLLRIFQHSIICMVAWFFYIMWGCMSFLFLLF